jgi:hypothetical protein
MMTEKSIQKARRCTIFNHPREDHRPLGHARMMSMLDYHLLGFVDASGNLEERNLDGEKHLSNDCHFKPFLLNQESENEKSGPLPIRLKFVLVVEAHEQSQNTTFVPRIRDV